MSICTVSDEFVLFPSNVYTSGGHICSLINQTPQGEKKNLVVLSVLSDNIKRSCVHTMSGIILQSRV
jgi:hypothetical protein